MKGRAGQQMRRLAAAGIAVFGLAGCFSGRSGTGNAAAVGVGATQVGSLAPTTTLPVGVTTSSLVQLVDVVTAMTLAADPSVTVVDVRTPAEFAEGHIARAVLVDFDAPGFSDRIAQLDRSATYLVYCHSGNRSAQATAVMAALGFSRVNNLAGGISAWQTAGAPVVQ